MSHLEHWTEALAALLGALTRELVEFVRRILRRK